MRFYFHSLEFHLKDSMVAHALANELQALKAYIITSAYNIRLALYLNHQFLEKSKENNLNSYLWYANILYQKYFVKRRLIKDIVKKCFILVYYTLFLTYSKNDLKELVKSCTGQLSKKEIFSYMTCENTGLRSDEFYMVYRAILNTSSRKNKKKQKLQDQIEIVFQVIISC